MSIAAGRLRHRVDIEEFVTDQDTAGDVVSDWVPVAENIPAAIEPMSARELMQSQAMQSTVSTRITIRWRPGLNASMRVVHGSNRYRIHGVLTDKESGRDYITLPVSLLEE